MLPIKKQSMLESRQYFGFWHIKMHQICGEADQGEVTQVQGAIQPAQSAHLNTAFVLENIK